MFLSDRAELNHTFITVANTPQKQLRILYEFYLKFSFNFAL